MSRAESSLFSTNDWKPAGVLILALAVSLVLVGRPFIAHWSERAARLDVAREQVQAQVDAMFSKQTYDSASAKLDFMLAQQPTRVLRARSQALAASALQSLLLELAEQSNVSVTRLNALEADSSGKIPFEVAANSDIYGLTDLLERMRTARYQLDVRKLQVQNNSALRGAPDVLQISMTLHAPVIVE